MGAVITSTTNSVRLDVTSLSLDHTKIVRSKQNCSLVLYANYICYLDYEGVERKMNLVGGTNILPVASVNGVTPTDLNHLFTLLEDILA
jgi:hypothetical protein